MEMNGSAQEGWRGHPLLRGGQSPYPHHFNAEEMKGLASICEALVPSLDLHSSDHLTPSEGVQANSSRAESQEVLAKGSLDAVNSFYKLSASEFGLPEVVAGHMFRRLKPEVMMIMGWVLWLITSSVGTLLLCGTQALDWQYPFIHSFPELPVGRREKALQSWAKSSLGLYNKIFKAFKGFVLFNFYGGVDENGQNPSWSAIGFCGADPKAFTEEPSYAPRPLEGKVLDPESSKETLANFLQDGGFTLLEDFSHLRESNSPAEGMKSGSDAQAKEIGVQCDVVVVGSGTGGGVIAGALAKAGHKVLILEKGKYFARGDLSLLETPTFDAMYEGGGVLSSDDGNVNLLAGATVGGGSAVNWAASFQTPNHVREEWAKEHGLSFFATEKYQEALDEVCARGSVRSILEHHSFQNQVLTNGCKALGYDIGEIPRNTPAEHLCGWCHLGCKRGEKQATSETWLVDAVQAGALIISNCTVQEVLHKEDHHSKKGRKAVGVVATCGGTLTLYVESAVTVVSGGSLSTPPLLLRSGLTNPNIGRHLHLHPVVMGWGYFPEGKGPVGKQYEGAIMTAVSREAANWNSSGYGALLEVPVLSPASVATLIPWRSGADHKGRMRRYPRTSFFIVLTRDKGSGRVGVDKNKERIITYSLSAEDQENMFQALEKGLRVMKAAGAEEVGTLHWSGETFSVSSSSQTMEEDFEKFLQGIHKRGLDGLKSPLCSAHQMGSCRMGSSSQNSVVHASGETWEVEDLFLGDASVFPTASGVNPMITVQAIAFCTAQNIILKLKDR